MSDERLYEYKDAQGFNILMVASKAGRLDVVKNLIERGLFDVNFEVDGECAASLAFDEEYHEVVLMLLKANAKFPKNINFETSSAELKQFLNLSKEMHDKVKNFGNLEQVQNFLSQTVEANQSLKYFYDFENCSLIVEALKAKNFPIVKFLWEIGLKTSPGEHIWSAMDDFTDDDLKKFHKMHLAIFENFFELSDREIVDFEDFRGFNALMLAVEFNRIEEAKYCIEKGLVLLDQSFNGYTAASLAFSYKHFEILLMLLKANAQFPYNFNPDDPNLTEEIKNFIDISTSIHVEIESGDVKKIEQILKTNKNLRFFYDVNNRSAFRHSIELKNFEVYKLLIMNFISFGPNENFTTMLSGMTDKEKEKLSQIQLDLATPLVSPVVLSLMAHSIVGVDNKNKKREVVMEAYNFLLTVPRAISLLKIVAAQKNYQIVFDFSHDSIQHVDPNSGIYARGAFDFCGRIYIAAEKLFDEQERCRVIGTLAHELCHFAMQVTFKNSARPHRVNDEVRKEEFLLIVNEYKKRFDSGSISEEIVSAVFQMYDKSLWSAELIVRPIQIDAQYHEKVEELESKRKEFKQIFDFYDDHCMPEMEKIAREIPNPFEELQKLKKFNVGLMILVALSVLMGGLVAFLIFDPAISWSDLSSEDRIKIKDSVVNFQGVDVKFGELFVNDSKVFDLLSSEQIKKALKGDSKELSRALNQTLHHQVFLTWSNMTQKLKEKFFTLKVDFQGQKVSIGNLTRNDKTLKLLNSLNVREIFEENFFAISKNVEEKVKIYIKRFLIDTTFKVLSEQKLNSLRKAGSAKYEDIQYYKNGEIDASRLNVIGFKKIVELIEKSRLNSCLKLSEEERREKNRQRFYLRLKRSNDLIKGRNMSRFIQHAREMEDDKIKDHYFYNFDQICESLTSSKVFLLSSAAGDGKSTTFRHFSLKLKEKFSQKWIQFVDLKKHIKAFELGQNLNLNDFEVLSNFLGEKLLGLEGFELEIFKELFASSKVIFLFDGVDEISPNFKNFMLDFTERIKETSNYQFVSTRPQHSEEFKDKFHIKSLRLIPFSEVDRFELLTKTIAEKKFNEEGTKIFEDLKPFYQENFKNFSALKYEKYSMFISKAQDILKFNEVSMSSEDRFVSNPLLILMVSEISCDENFKVENSTFNSYQLYDTFIDQKLEIVDEKGKIVQKDRNKALKSRDLTILKVHQYFALKLIFSTIQSIEKYARKVYFNLIDLGIKQSVEKFSFEQISRYGILQVNSENDFDFAHRSFAEFFVAQFLLDFLSLNDAIDLSKVQDKLSFLAFHDVWFGSFPIIKSFMFDGAKMEFLNIRFFKYWNEEVESKKFLLCDSTLNLFEQTKFAYYFNMQKLNAWHTNFKNCYIGSSIVNESLSLARLERNFGRSFMRTILTYRSVDTNENFFLCVMHYGRQLNLSLELVKFAKKHLNKSEIVSFFMEPGYNRENILLESLDKNITFTQTFWSFIKKSFAGNDYESFVEISSSQLWKERSIEKNIFPSIKSILEKIFTRDEIKKLFLPIKNFYTTMIQYRQIMTDIQVQVIEYMREIFKLDDFESVGITMDATQFLEIVNKDTFDKVRHTWMITVALYNNDELKQRKILDWTTFKERPWTALKESALSDDSKVFPYLKEIYERLFSTDEISKMLTVNLNNGSIFHIENANPGTRDFLKDIYNRNFNPNIKLFFKKRPKPSTFRSETRELQQT